MKRKSLLITTTFQSKLIETTNGFIRDDGHIHSNTLNCVNLVRDTPTRKAPDTSSDTEEIPVVDSPGKNPAQPEAPSRTRSWKTKPPENSDMAVAKPKAKRVRKANPPTASRLGPTDRLIYARSTMQLHAVEVCLGILVHEKLEVLKCHHPSCSFDLVHLKSRIKRLLYVP